MGFAIAEAARDRGAEVTVIHGSVSAEIPAGIRTIRIETARDLYDAMMAEAGKQDVIIQAAAVCDYRPAEQKDRKIKKEKGKNLVLELTENPDIARAVGEQKRAGQTLVGFAAETDHVQQNAQKKLAAKNLDMIVANDVTKPGAGFNTDTNIAALITADRIIEEPLQTKRQLAEKILDRVMEIRAGQ
jgi:phosphopantothenoylcysteine decarboxylase/phosphopantothenate--cysteine ligase